MPITSVHHHSGHRLRDTILTIVLIPVALLLAVLCLGFVSDIFIRSERIRQGDYTSPISETNAPTSTLVYQGNQALIEGKNNYSLGDSEPQVTIVEFSDFACPFCLASFPALREISVKYQDKVKVIFRDWPGHDYSLSLAQAAYCAGEQGKFWEMHDKLFQNQSDTFGSDKNQLAILAQQLGIYNAQFQACFDSQKYLPQIRANYVDSQTLGVTGTPTWFINGRKVEGQLSSAELEQLLAPYLR